MWNEPTKEDLAKLPRLYETESVPLRDKQIHLHFFLAGCDWYVAEYDGEDLFWGYAILNGDHDNAEWGYMSFEELKALKMRPGLEVDLDLYWKVRPASQVDNITNL